MSISRKLSDVHTHNIWKQILERGITKSKDQRLSKEKESPILTPAKGIGERSMRSGLIFHTGPRKDTGKGKSGQGQQD